MSNIKWLGGTIFQVSTVLLIQPHNIILHCNIKYVLRIPEQQEEYIH